MSNEQKTYLKKEKRKRLIIFITQIFIFILFLTLWQFAADKELINSFITSSPKEIFSTLITLYKENNLFYNIWVTVKETIIAFSITTLLSLFISIILYNYKFLSKVFDPYLIILNSLPKVALGQSL